MEMNYVKAMAVVQMLFIQSWKDISSPIFIISTADISTTMLIWGDTWYYERLKAGRKGDDRGWDGRMASWLDGHEFDQGLEVDDGQGSQSCCSPGGSQRVSHDWGAELRHLKFKRTEWKCYSNSFFKWEN